MPSRTGRADVVLAVLLLAPSLLGAGYAAVALVAEGGDVPADEDYEAIGRALRGSAFDGDEHDRMAILPAWSLRPLVALKRVTSKPAPFLSGDRLADQPLDRVRDLYVVLEPDGERAFAAVEARLGPGEIVGTSGPVTLHRFALGGPHVVDDLSARLAGAEVEIRKGSATVAKCDQKKPDGWGCQGRKEWQNVTRKRLLVSENGDLALWAHPPGAGEELVVRWPDAELGDELVIRAGPTRTGASWAKAPVRVRVLVGDDDEKVEVASFERGPRFGFDAERIDTTRFAGSTLPVTVVIDTRDHGKNHFAFDLFTSRRAGGARAGTGKGGPS